ncbi:MAG TPA: hypothetical protein DCY79_15975 [Planctomycetaceae bacterium]|nr:hypothetical protein [Planctomycetaceae bacterium]
MTRSQIAASQKARRLMRFRLPLLFGFLLNLLVVCWIPCAQLARTPRAVAKEAPRKEPQPTLISEVPSDADREQATTAVLDSAATTALEQILQDNSLTSTETSEGVETPERALPVSLAPDLTGAFTDVYAVTTESPEKTTEPAALTGEPVLPTFEPILQAPVLVESLEPELLASLTTAPGPSPQSLITDEPTSTDEVTSYLELFAIADDTSLEQLGQEQTVATPEIAADEVLIRNPLETNGAVHFLVQDEVVTLQPGESYRSRLAEQELLLQFHRGSSFGNAKQQLTPGLFEFQVSPETGWRLQSPGGLETQP